LTVQDVLPQRGKNKTEAAPMRWFRMYSEFATDPKVQMLSEADQRRYMMLLCLRCSNGDVTLQDAECAFQMRISESEYAATKAVLIARGLIDEANQPTAWDRRQYVSDTSKSRVSKHRERKRQEPKRVCNVTVTAPETDTEADTDTENKIEQVEAAQQASAALPTSISCDELEAKLWKAAGPCLADPVNAQGLISLSVPRMWLAEGADLELDVLETLKAQAVKCRGRKIQNWNYFTNPVAEAMARRKAGMPIVDITATPKQSAKAAGAANARAALDRMMGAPA
jgi:hypothetical protein